MNNKLHSHNIYAKDLGSMIVSPVSVSLRAQIVDFVGCALLMSFTPLAPTMKFSHHKICLTFELVKSVFLELRYLGRLDSS